MNKCQECSRLRVLLKAYLMKFPAFRSKPSGAPYSKERNQQQEHIALEDLARAAFTGDSDETGAPQGLWDHEPTPDMIRVGIHVWSRNERASTADDVRAIYIAMRRLEGKPTQKAMANRLCICSDPENCTQRIPGYRCKKDFMSTSRTPTSKAKLYQLADPENDLFSDAMDRAVSAHHSVRHGAMRNAERASEGSITDGEKIARRALAAGIKAYLEEIGPNAPESPVSSKSSDNVEAVAARIFEQARVCNDASYVMVPRFLIGKLREAIKAHGNETRAFGQEGWRVALPVITPEIFNMHGGQSQLIEMEEGGKLQWTQAAVDFGCMLQECRSENAAPNNSLCAWPMTHPVGCCCSQKAIAVACGNPVMVGTEFYGPCKQPEGHAGKCDPPVEDAKVQSWPWPMCNGCGNEQNACTCDSQSENER